MAVAIGVGAVTSIVGKEGSTTLKFGVGGRDTGVDYVDAGTLTAAGVIGVGSAASLAVDVRDPGQTPGRRALSGVGPLLDAVNLAKVGLDNGILLDIINLQRISMYVSEMCRNSYTREVADQLDDIVCHISGEATEATEVVDVGRVLPENL